jgi:hypothetical protein
MKLIRENEGGIISLDEMLRIWIKYSQKEKETLLNFEEEVAERIIRHIHALAPKVFYDGGELEELVMKAGQKIVDVKTEEVGLKFFR